VTSTIKEFYATSALSGSNADYVEELYESFLADQNSVSAKWQSYFNTLRGNANDVPHAPVKERMAAIGQAGVGALVLAASTTQSNDAGSAGATAQAAVLKLINVYRTRGHLQANLDPLGMAEKPAVPELDAGTHGLGANEMQQVFNTGNVVGAGNRKLSDVLAQLAATYCGSIGAEYMHINEDAERTFFRERLEAAAGRYGFDAVKKKRVLQQLTAAEGLERYLHTKYTGQKRFSLEGGDSLMPLMDEMIHRFGAVSGKEAIIGMAHRGRLNVLVNTLGKPPRELFDAFEGKHTDRANDPAHSGDVKYHLGFSSDIKTSGGPLHLALGFNPSHLEIINPVVAGSVKARQTRRRDVACKTVLPILIHGDSAFAGQGVNLELFAMSQARGFKVGGTVHVVVNNQVGFTTSNPQDTRSTHYCTDVAKMVNAPVLHVNGDDPEAVVFCAQLALDYRQQFGKDVVIDLVCYRRHGHNEADEPAATQPVMYQAIRARRTVRDTYAESLQKEGIIAIDEAAKLLDAYKLSLDSGLPVVAELTGPESQEYANGWRPYLDGSLDEAVNTGVDAQALQSLSGALHVLPADLKLHPRVAKVYEDRLKMAAGELRMDWGFAETVAYASLLAEGFNLRLVGQDAGRGTFFHRHAVLHDQVTDGTYMPLAKLTNEKNQAVVIDSLLSEEAVMGFEYGHATTDPSTLTIWEGQFGDFCNGAQVVIDQFISSGESKWSRLCGLVLFLPHGYEGQGPEHSSARLERFLQLCALNNMQVCVPTTPAQMFHMLRRQMQRKVRKPLIVMTPKSMLRNKLSTSSLADLQVGYFQNVIADSTAKNQFTVNRVVLCAGKVYYDLIEEAEKRGATDVAIIRVEQLYPFPRIEVTAELKKYAVAKQIVWCQEEPMNQGAWFQIRHHIHACLSPAHELHYAGRNRSAAPACGHLNTHNIEQAALLNEALGAALGQSIKPE
jgi:2-oxoglutarate dehydrogenase E1 component